MEVGEGGEGMCGREREKREDMNGGGGAKERRRSGRRVWGAETACGVGGGEGGVEGGGRDGPLDIAYVEFGCS